MRAVSFFLLVAGASLTSIVWAYATFEQKDSAMERKADIVKRLDTIETKLDLLLIRKGH